MDSDKDWLRDVSVCAVHGDSAWYVCYEDKTHRLRLTHRGTWSMDDMDIYWKSQAEAFAGLHVAPCPLEDPYARIATLEATERELREAVKVLAEEVSAWSTGNFVTHQCQLPNGGECTGCKASERRQRATDAARANPIASAAVREAGQ